jgi:hypothetical protein
MTAAENPFVSDTSSLQSQLKEKEKELLAAKAEVEALRTNEELKDRVFKEVTCMMIINSVCDCSTKTLSQSYL